LESCLICDDHAMMREALVGSVRLAWPGAAIAEAQDYPGAVAAARGMPDLIMCDLSMPGADPVPGVTQVMAAAPGVPVLIVTGLEDDAVLMTLFDLGIAGFLPKKSTSKMIEAAIRVVESGGKFVPPRVLELAAARPGAAPLPAALVEGASVGRLTARQIDVLSQIASGKTDKEIARLLAISPATVKAHAMAAFSALGAANRAEAVAKALALGAIRAG
jgi:two-component system, NarL family, nitrate/nitrite response regulator NarL